VAQANTLADLRGWTRFVGLQIRYSLADRAAERDLLPMARSLDIAVTPWSVLGAGVLTGKYKRGDAGAAGRAARWDKTDRDLAIAAEVAAVADEIGRTPAQVAINWVRQQPGVIIPLIGAKTVAHLHDNLGCLDFALTAEQMQRLSAASKIELGFPHDFLASNEVRDLVTGGSDGKLDNHRS
jgi:aryl-alcohol dehydrogenase-like predicted oxidoreductase